MTTGEHWNDYPPDDPPQGAWCSRCEHNAEDCECPPNDADSPHIEAMMEEQP